MSNNPVGQINHAADELLVKALKELIAKAESDIEGHLQYAALVASLLPKNLVESLRQLIMINGPVYDGDVISKSLGSELFDLGLAMRVCVRGEEGYTVATYFAFSVLNCFDEINAGKIRVAA